MRESERYLVIVALAIQLGFRGLGLYEEPASGSPVSVTDVPRYGVVEGSLSGGRYEAAAEQISHALSELSAKGGTSSATESLQGLTDLAGRLRRAGAASEAERCEGEILRWLAQPAVDSRSMCGRTMNLCAGRSPFSGLCQAF